METNRSEIRYNVVNHSAAELGDLTLHVLLRATTAQESQPPVSRFSFKLPSLGPYESREMVSVVEKINRVYEIPDWRNLKAEFQITSP
jgi:NTP pyrophosphatase (non-canonical NTP hydrolase)